MSVLWPLFVIAFAWETTGVWRFHSHRTLHHGRYLVSTICDRTTCNNMRFAWRDRRKESHASFFLDWLLSRLEVSQLKVKAGGSLKLGIHLCLGAWVYWRRRWRNVLNSHLKQHISGSFSLLLGLWKLTLDVQKFFEELERLLLENVRVFAAYLAKIYLKLMLRGRLCLLAETRISYEQRWWCWMDEISQGKGTCPRIFSFLEERRDSLALLKAFSRLLMENGRC